MWLLRPADALHATCVISTVARPARPRGLTSITAENEQAADDRLHRSILEWTRLSIYLSIYLSWVNWSRPDTYHIIGSSGSTKFGIPKLEIEKKEKWKIQQKWKN